MQQRVMVSISGGVLVGVVVTWNSMSPLWPMNAVRFEFAPAWMFLFRNLDLMMVRYEPVDEFR